MKDNYFLAVCDFAQCYNLETGYPYFESRKKDMRLLKDLSDRGVLEQFGDFRKLFAHYFKWYAKSWHKENSIKPTIGILVKNIQKIAEWKEEKTFTYKEL